MTESQVFELYSTGPGEISPVSFLFYDGQKAKPTDVTKQIIMRQLLSDYVH
ncbi:MAG: hypothetical protein MJ201_05490 [Mycoplasmoidaceae bacterium]|nr:hypothetical protein [Mycoplasmoidaceae bacterium]